MTIKINNNSMERIFLNESYIIDLHEAKTTILTEFEKKFGKDFVYSTELDFEFDENTFNAVYSILNAYLFDNKLKQNKLKVYKCTIDDIVFFVNKMNVKNINPNNLYAAYVPEVDNKTGKLKSDSMFLVKDYGKMTFLFSVGELCHEMIHQYDANFGILIKLAKEDELLNIDRLHETPFFVRFQKLAALEGIKVMTDGNNTPFDILNKQAVQFTINLQEDDNAKFFDLVKKLEAGEKIPNMCLTDRGTVAFFIP